MAKSTSKLFDEKPVVDTTAKEIMNPPVNDDKTISEALENTPDDIIDIELEVVKKKRFRFNKDNSKILELNTSDLNVITRLTTAYDELVNLMEDVGKTLSELPDDTDTESNMEQVQKISDILKQLDNQMREKVDYIFDAPVSSVLAPEGSMYDPIDGNFRYEIILDKIASLYGDTLNKEFAKMKKRVASKTSQYTQKKFHK
jgi:hypothetical protein